ncbi:MAG: type IV pilus assembly protein PilM [Phycisphaerae bacterium]|jgi:type IV pilus assembly protein PilM
MPTSKPVWAIDIGNNSLKALRLVQNGDKIDVTGLDYIEYPKVLSAEGITEEEKEQIIRASLNTFVGRNELAKDPIAISVPGQTSFARFIKLPPVDPKRVPEIVKFEAIQQIPFDINEVEWDWQLMEKPDSPDTEVGIFAIKNELVGKYLENFAAENLRVSIVQMSPIALYNYAWFDRNDLDDAEKKAVVLLDMGADNTNLVVCTKLGVWQRCIPLGGNNFTKAVSEAFKLPFEKAERLKRGAPMSKYARQIFHAMKPVFTDFGTEVQRSLGYYSNSHKNTAFVKTILLGGGFKMQGLNKYLQQTTQLAATRPDAFEKLTSSASVSSAKLHENISDFAIAYGLGIQALGQGKIESNLLPAKIARTMLWAQKSKFFIIAAAILVVVSLLAFLRTNMDLKAYNGREPLKYRTETQQILEQAGQAANNLSTETARGAGYDAVIKEYTDFFKYRDVVPLLHEMLLKTLPNAENNQAQKELYTAYAAGEVEKIKLIPRPERKQVFITSIGINFSDSLAAAPLEVAKLDSSSRTSGSYNAGGGTGMEGMGLPTMGMPVMGMPGMQQGGGGMTYRPQTQMQTPVPGAESQEISKDGAGFVVVIEGYCPYEKIGELLEPAGVGNNQDKWGIKTRLMNLNKFYTGDGNCPFELFEENKIEHFKIETGTVDLDNKQTMPTNIGVLEEIVRIPEEEVSVQDTRGRSSRASAADSDKVPTETVLLDPLTKEEISKTFDLDDKGRKKLDSFGKPMFVERDKWFRIKFKILWKNSPPGTAKPGM